MKLIDADALEKAVKNMPGEYYGDLCIGDALREIDEAPTIDAVPVVRGKWQYRMLECARENWDDEYKCSVCGEIRYNATNYCPNCGAKMEAE